jgi:predicted CopG family antitoxin
VLEELLDKKRTDYDIGQQATAADEVIEKVKKEHSRFWEF